MGGAVEARRDLGGALVAFAAALTAAGGFGALAALADAAGPFLALDVFDVDLIVAVDVANFGGERPAAQQGIDGLGDFMVHDHALAFLDLDEDVEGGRGFAFEHGLLGAAAAGLLVGQGDGIDAADQVGEGWVHEQVFEGIAVGGADELDAAFGDGAGGDGFELAADFVDDDGFGHVIFDGFDHDFMLQGGRCDLHAAGAADGWVGDVAVAGDFVAGIDDDDAFFCR